MTDPFAPQAWDHTTATGNALPWHDEDRAALVAMVRMKPKNTDWSDLTERVIDRGGARLLWQDDHPRDLFGHSDGDIALKQAIRDIDSWTEGPYELHTFMDPSYPEQLRSVRRVPPLVFTQGSRRPGESGVCVVGSRNTSQAGARFARIVTEAIVDLGITVVAGLAKGIDTVAHRTALDHGGRTVAVLGNGFDRVYPQENQDLQQEIAERGMLLTHFMPEYAPSRWSFPARNATMSAYSIATVIAEAGETSGTRIQAREAVAQGRPVILSLAVAQSTDWGHSLKDAPGVHVANSAQHAIELVGRIHADQTMISQLLSDIS